jgi:hypothetical protein
MTMPPKIAETAGNPYRLIAPVESITENGWGGKGSAPRLLPNHVARSTLAAMKRSNPPEVDLRPIEFAERKTDELMKHHLDDMAILTREAHVTFAFTMTVLSAAFGYFLKLYEPARGLLAQDWAWLGPVLLLTLHLGLAGAYVLRGALMACPVQPPGNLPETLIGENAPHRHNVAELRKAEMWGVATRIEFNRNRNYATARVVNRARIALLCAPGPCLVVWVLAQTVVACWA